MMDSTTWNDLIMDSTTWNDLMDMGSTTWNDKVLSFGAALHSNHKKRKTNKIGKKVLLA